MLGYLCRLCGELICCANRKEMATGRDCSHCGADAYSTKYGKEATDGE